MSKAYVLLSGGIDSSSALAIAKERFGSVTAVSVYYGQLHNIELAYAIDIAKALGAEHRVVNMHELIGKGGLSDPNLNVPEVSYADLPEGVSPTYVPNRNMLLLSMLVSQASADPEAVAAYYGAHAEDAENDAYPDCSLPFVVAMTAAIRIATYGKIELFVPFVSKTKAQVVREGERLDVPWRLTWSCYKGGNIHCGICSTCRARQEAFHLAGIHDPTIYANKPE